PWPGPPPSSCRRPTRASRSCCSRRGPMGPRCWPPRGRPSCAGTSSDPAAASSTTGRPATSAASSTRCSATNGCGRASGSGGVPTSKPATDGPWSPGGSSTSWLECSRDGARWARSGELMEPREYERSFAVEGGHWWFRAKRALVLSLLRRYGAPGGRGVDIGCGTGGMLQALERDGESWVGVDAERLALAYCRKRGLPRLVQGSGTALPLRAGAFDACLCLDVLYHRAVASDAAALAE